MAEEKEKAKGKKGSTGSSKVSSRATSRPGTSGSTGTRKSSTSLSRNPSSMAQADKDKGDGVAGRDGTRPRSREDGGREDAPPLPGSEGLSKAALREIEAREKRQREWEQEWTDRRNLAHSGMHIQESDLEMYSVTRRIVRRSSYEEQKDEDKEVDEEKPVFVVSGLNWRQIDGIPMQGRRELKDKWKLEVALMSRQTFGQHEWDSFGIKDLRQDDYIKSGGKYWEPGMKIVQKEKPAAPLDIVIERDFSMLHGIAFAYYAHQTIWHVNAQQPNPGGSKRRPHLLFVMGSDGNVHVACVEDVPSNKLKHVDEQQGITPYAAGGNQGSDQGGEGERPESPPLWTREWVFIAKLSGAGGLDNDREMGHPRMQVCPVDSSLIAICSGPSLEIWVNPGQSVDPKKSQSLFLGGDSDSSSGEEEMDYSGLRSPKAVKAALKVHQASGNQSFSNWMLLAELREHRDLVKAVAWRLDGRLLVSGDSMGQLKFWARGWDKGVQTLQKFSDGAGGWRCFQTMPIPVSMDDRVPEEATDFSRGPSDGGASNPGTPTSSRAPSLSVASHGSSFSGGSVPDEYPQDTCAQVLSLTFGVGPCATLLFVGLDDDSVTVIDTEGLAPMLEQPYDPAGAVLLGDE